MPKFNKKDQKKSKFSKDKTMKWKVSHPADEEPKGKITHNKFGSSENDPNWYYISENLGRAAGSLPYNVFTGTKEAILPSIMVRQPSTDRYETVHNISDNSTPGVMVLEYDSVPGTSLDATSAVNVTARAIYSFVRHENSGSKNYESPDLMMYILGMAQAYNLIFEAKRIYRLAVTYDAVNRYIPDLLLTALGADPADIRNNLAQFRYGINVAIAKLSSLYIPKQFNIFKRQALLSTVVLTDSSSIRSQFYTYRLHDIYKFTGIVESTGSALIPESLGNNRSAQTILNQINRVIDALLSDEDINIMSGDILKAYKVEGCYSIPDLNELETQQFIYDEDMLNQIENAYCAHDYVSDLIDAPKVTQAAGHIIFKPTFDDQLGEGLEHHGIGNYIAANQRFFNSHKDEPDYKDNFEWSRFSTTASYQDDSKGYYEVASELLRKFVIYTYHYDDNNLNPTIKSYSFGSNVHDFGLWDLLRIMTAASMFDWHPILYLSRVVQSDPVAVNYFGALYDSKVHTIVDANTLARMHQCAVMGLFAAGSVSK